MRERSICYSTYWCIHWLVLFFLFWFNLTFTFYFLKYILLVMLLQLSHFFLPFIPLHPAPPIPPAFLNLVHAMGHTYKFFGFYISYIILNLPLFCTYNLCFLFPVPFPPFSPLPLPTENLPCDLHFCESDLILQSDQIVCLVCFCVCFFRFSCC